MKKREKKKFSRQNIKIRNISAHDTDRFEDMDLIEEKRATKKKFEKGEFSQKSDMILKKGRVQSTSSNFRYSVYIDDKIVECRLSGRLKQINFMTKNIVSVGDFVNVDISKEPVIEEILPRQNILSRFLDNEFQTEIIIASNIDQVIITVSVKNPQLNFSLIDRYICNAKILGIKPIICVNKIDLAEDFLILSRKFDFYRENGYKIIFTSTISEGKGLDTLKTELQNKDSLFSGHSGTGKSSLINKLQSGLNLKVSSVSRYHNKGLHTTTASKLIKWDFGGHLIDSPGIRIFQLNKEDKDKIPVIFPGFGKLRGRCYYQNCSHTHEKICGIKEAVKKKEYPMNRYRSFLRLYESLK